MEQEEMPKRRLDLLGFFCPIPVHETRKALSEMQEGELLEVYGDDPELFMICLLSVTESEELLNVEEVSGEYRFLIRK